MKKLIILLLLLPALSFSQSRREERRKNRAKEVGEFQLGMRSTMSKLDNYGFPELGYGGMFLFQQLLKQKLILSKNRIGMLIMDFGGCKETLPSENH